MNELSRERNWTAGEKAGTRKRVWVLVLSIIAVSWFGSAILPSIATSLGDRGPCAIASRVVSVARGLTTHLYFPTEDTCSAGMVAPYPAVAFAHGFSMFGLSNRVQDNQGNGEHLASWGYVVAIPELPDDL